MNKIDKAKTRIDDVADDEAVKAKPDGEVDAGEEAKPKTPEEIEAERKKAFDLRKKRLDKDEWIVKNKRGYGGEFFRMKDLVEGVRTNSELHVSFPDMNEEQFKGKEMRVFIWFPQNGGQKYDNFISKKVYESVMEARKNGEPIALVVLQDNEAGRGHTNWDAFRDRRTYSAIIDHVEKLSGGRRLANNVTLGASSGGYKGIAHVLQNMQKSIRNRAKLKKVDRSNLSEEDKARYDDQMATYNRDSALYAGIGGVGLFDSLYGYAEDIANWATSNPLNRLFSYWGTTHTAPHNKKLAGYVDKFYKSRGEEVPSSKMVYPAPHIGHDVGVPELRAFLSNSVSSDIEVPPRKAKNIPINVSVSTASRTSAPSSSPSPSAPSSGTPSAPPLEPVTPVYRARPSKPSNVDSTPDEPSPEAAKTAPVSKPEPLPEPLPPAETPSDAESPPPETEKAKPVPDETRTGPHEYIRGKEKPTISALGALRSQIDTEYKRYPTELFTNYPPGKPDPRANLDKIFGGEVADIKKFIIFNDPLSKPDNPKPVTFLGRKIRGGVNMMFYIQMKIAEEYIMQSGVNYQPEGNEVLGYQDRYMKLINPVPGNKTWSFHKPALAVDLDPGNNGPKHGRGNIPDQIVMGMVKAGMSWGLVQTESEPYFNRDPMHFQPRHIPGGEAWLAIVNASPVGRKYWEVIKPMFEKANKERGVA